jgi:hypothetical protein
LPLFVLIWEALEKNIQASLVFGTMNKSKSKSKKTTCCFWAFMGWSHNTTENQNPKLWPSHSTLFSNSSYPALEMEGDHFWHTLILQLDLWAKSMQVWVHGSS